MYNRMDTLEKQLLPLIGTLAVAAHCSSHGLASIVRVVSARRLLLRALFMQVPILNRDS